MGGVVSGEGFTVYDSSLDGSQGINYDAHVDVIRDLFLYFKEKSVNLQVVSEKIPNTKNANLMISWASTKDKEL